MKGKILTAFFLTVFCLMAFQADAAASISIRFINDGYPVTQNYSGSVGGESYSGAAGIYNFYWSTDPVTPGVDNPFQGFCIDPRVGSFSYSSYTLLAVTGERQKMAAWLFNEFRTGGLNDDYLVWSGGSPVVISTLAAATQTAIWELVLDTGNNVSPTNGNTYTSSLYVALAQNLVNSALAHEDYDASGYRWAHSATYQDLLVPNVPIPGAVWLLGSGLLGLVALRRRMSK